MTYLNFDALTGSDSASWTRADPDQALIERHSPTDFVVMLRDGADSHAVVYGLERDARVGYCDCKGFEYADEGVPCAHLCVLRKAEFIGTTTVDDERVEAVDTAALADANHDPGLRADGGRVPQPTHDPDGVEVVDRPDSVRPEAWWSGR